MNSVVLVDMDQWTQLGDLVDEGERPEFLADILATFREKTPGILAALRAAVESSSAKQVQQYAHQLKGSCSNIGAQKIAVLSQEIENKAAKGVVVALAAVEELDRTFAETMQELEKISA